MSRRGEPKVEPNVPKMVTSSASNSGGKVGGERRDWRGYIDSSRSSHSLPTPTHAAVGGYNEASLSLPLREQAVREALEDPSKPTAFCHRADTVVFDIKSQNTVATEAYQGGKSFEKDLPTAIVWDEENVAFAGIAVPRTIGGKKPHLTGNQFCNTGIPSSHISIPYALSTVGLQRPTDRNLRVMHEIALEMHEYQTEARRRKGLPGAEL